MRYPNLGPTIRAIQAAPGAPLSDGRDAAPPPGLTPPPGVCVDHAESTTAHPFRAAAGVPCTVTIELLWKREPWRWLIVALIAVFAVVLALFSALMCFGPRTIALGIIIALTLPFVLLFAYEHLGRLVNSTRVSLDGVTLVVRHHPLPWFGGKRIAWNRVKNVYAMLDRGVVRVFAELEHGPDAWIVRSSTSMGITMEQGEYLARHLALRVLPRGGGEPPKP